MDLQDKNLQFMVLNKLSDKDLVNYCSVNKETREICQNERFKYQLTVVYTCTHYHKKSKFGILSLP